MEMQQVRYFLAVAKTLNFTRAAEQCHVTQPALTRAIRQLEEELGGELIRREGRLSHLTDLGMRMLPLLTQCHDSALGAKSLAAQVQRGEVSVLAVGITRSFDLDLLLPSLNEVRAAFAGLQLRVMRGNGAQIAEWLKIGEIEVAIGGALSEGWDRLDSWPLFAEAFELVMAADFPQGADVEPAAVGGDARLLVHADAEEIPSDVLDRAGLCRDRAHEVTCARDLEVLVTAGFGVAMLPASAMRLDHLHRTRCPEPGHTRTVAAHATAGRARSDAAAALLALVRAADWSALQSY
ncbi:LysR family transcriptional regulator [Novosphingobium lentum]|uniref:LysR family transcriptional regulator n=1 Tax=Novosphingobium lentum TaxID=145287 RepID=UPI0008372FDA|nr:LysR family transcriptional regulator [Novosphingobium lentum]